MCKKKSGVLLPKINSSKDLKDSLPHCLPVGKPDRQVDATIDCYTLEKASQVLLNNTNKTGLVSDQGLCKKNTIFIKRSQQKPEEAMQTNYLKRKSEETRGDQFDYWGKATQYFETDRAGNVQRQIVEYSTGIRLRYDLENPGDEFGMLHQFKVAHSTSETIPEREFEKKWEHQNFSFCQIPDKNNLTDRSAAKNYPRFPLSDVLVQALFQASFFEDLYFPVMFAPLEDLGDMTTHNRGLHRIIELLAAYTSVVSPHLCAELNNARGFIQDGKDKGMAITCATKPLLPYLRQRITLKEATQEDVEVLYELIREIARHHDQEEEVLTNKKELLRAGFEKPARFGALIAEYAGEVAGYVSYTWNYAIWLGEEYMNIDDVFVKEEYRGRKIGEKLMQEAGKICASKQVTQIRWQVEKDNTKAIQFYERLGAKMTLKGIVKWNLS